MRTRAILGTTAASTPVFVAMALIMAMILLLSGAAGCATGNPGPGDNLCGNLALDDGEMCDDGNTANGDGCSDTCQVETAAVCGDGNVESNEQCDDGNTANGDGCSDTCQVETAAVCGDGNVEGSEQCDDGNTTDGDGCSATCTTETPANCGDGNVDAGEECDDGNTASEDGCSAACLDEYCGDGTAQAGLSEQCDDGNTADGDGCSATCQTEIPVVCGDGTREGSEQCDDGNTTSGDGCSATCQLDQLYLQPGPTDGKDAQVYSLEADTNYPTSVYSWAQAWTWSGTPGTRRSYFEFSLPAAMNGCTVSSATLHLYYWQNATYVHEGLSGNTLETEISRVTQAWDETTITWNNQPNVDTGSTLTLPPPATSTSDVQVDLTAMASHWFANPGSNHGFLFRLQTEVYYRQVVFTSSDYTDDPLQRPALSVDFSSCP